jgi:daunorubicin resistance ABC transporter ATP-binding subunit
MERPSGVTLAPATTGPAGHPKRAPDAAVLTERVGRVYGAVQAVVDVDLRIERGSVVGLLGPNGSGKTTLIRMLATLLRPTSGRAWVAGADVRAAPGEVRRRIGLTGQYAAVDPFLTGRESIQLVGRMLGMSRRDARTRAAQLLGSFDLDDAADRALSTYSGGMRRRLDLALSLTGRPAIVFLDEPTTGLDPRSRFAMWRVVEDLAADGTTVLLSTQYLDEADQLAERVVILDQGRVVAEGTPDLLRSRSGGDVVEVVVRDVADVPAAVLAVRAVATAPVDRPQAGGRLRIPVRDADALPDVVRALDAAGVPFTGLALHEPTLDDVFLTLTGRRTEPLQAERLPVEPLPVASS